MPKRRRRSFTPQFKAQVVLEVLSGQKSASESARQHKLKPELIARRKNIALGRMQPLFQGQSQDGQDQVRIAERGRIVGPLIRSWKPKKEPRPGCPRP